MSTNVRDHARMMGVDLADSLSEARRAEVIITIIGDDQALEDVVFGSGEFLSSIHSNSVHISASTISIAVAKRLAEVHAHNGSGFISAPIWGRPEVAASRQISVLAAGEQST